MESLKKSLGLQKIVPHWLPLSGNIYESWSFFNRPTTDILQFSPVHFLNVQLF